MKGLKRQENGYVNVSQGRGDLNVQDDVEKRRVNEEVDLDLHNKDLKSE